MFKIKLVFLGLSLVIITNWSDAVEHTIQDLNFKAEALENMLQLPQDDWLNLTLMGTKIGYAHVHAEKSEYEGEPAIRIRSEVVMEIKRTGTGMFDTSYQLAATARQEEVPNDVEEKITDLPTVKEYFKSRYGGQPSALPAMAGVSTATSDDDDDLF